MNIEIFNKLNIINLGYFNNIKDCYVIGDLHGDVFKFLEFLKTINIIINYNIPNNYNCYNFPINKIKKDIDELIIFNNNLNLKNTCIVQLGDICDGHNTCKMKNKNFINNDIMIYMIIDKIIQLFKKFENSYFILISGNHDLFHIFEFYTIEELIKKSNCDIYKPSAWPQYILNYDEIILNQKDKEKILKKKLIKRKNYLQNDFNIVDNLFFIVSINNKTFFSHTLLYKSLFDKINKLNIKQDFIKILNQLLKIAMLYISKKYNYNKISFKTFNKIVKKLMLLCQQRSKKYFSNDLINEGDIFNLNGHYFVGHEVQKHINKIKHNMLNLYIYYVDIGLSKSIYDIDTKKEYYYVYIKFNNPIQIYKCNNPNNCLII